jgi:hypothetical protein
MFAVLPRVTLIPLAWIWQPIAPAQYILGSTAILVALAVLAYVRTYQNRVRSTSGLLGMRIGLIATIAVLLLGPSSVPQDTIQPTLPKLRILMDTSQSMRTRDCQGMSRLEFVQERILSESRLRSLAREFRVEVDSFDTSLHSMSLWSIHGDPNALASGPATHLSECVAAAVSQVSTQENDTSLVVISDGRDTEGEPVNLAATSARNRNLPIDTIVVGSQTLSADVAVLAAPMQNYLLPNEPGAIFVKVYQTGLENTQTTLTVTHGEAKQTIPLAIGNRPVVELQVPVQQAEPGQYEYSVSVEPFAAETERGNNRQTVFCDVQKKRIRVLILEGQPFWDSKFLAQSLRKDEHLDVTQITQLSRSKRETLVTRTEDGSPSIPSVPEEWEKYDVVILGQAIENVVREGTIGLLDDFVSNHGGHLVFARGLPYDPQTAPGQAVAKDLANLEPVVWGKNRLEKVSLSLTPSGRGSQWFSLAKTGVDADQALADLPGFEKTNTIERAKPATIVLAEALAPAKNSLQSQPAIVRMTYGRGTVVGVLGEGLWRWSLLPPDKRQFNGFYDTFWSNLVRWLAMGGEFSPDQQVALHINRGTVRLGDPLVIDVVYKQAPPTGAAPKLELIDPSQRPREIALSPVASREPRFRATVKPQMAGIHRIQLQTPSMQPAKQERRFNVCDVNQERLITAADPMSLRMLAEHSGGHFYEMKQAADLAEHLHQLRVVEHVPPKLEYIWDQGTIMVLILVWTGSEWLLRRCAGLI